MNTNVFIITASKSSLSKRLQDYKFSKITSRVSSSHVFIMFPVLCLGSFRNYLVSGGPAFWNNQNYVSLQKHLLLKLLSFMILKQAIQKTGPHSPLSYIRITPSTSIIVQYYENQRLTVVNLLLPMEQNTVGIKFSFFQQKMISL